MLRVAFVSQPRDPFEAQGAQRGSVAIVTAEIASRLASSHEVTVHAPAARGQPLEERTREGVHIRRVPHVLRTLHKAIEIAGSVAGLGSPWFASPLYFREYAAAVAARLARDPPDIVHVQTHTQFLPLLRAAAPHARLVLHVHDGTLAGLPVTTVRRWLHAADAVVACSPYVARRIAARFPEFAGHVHAIGNGVDALQFRPRRIDGAAGAWLRVLYVGRVSPEKGVHVLVRAFARIAREHRCIELDVVGPEGLIPHGHLALLCDHGVRPSLERWYGATAPERVQRQLLEARTGYRASLEAELEPDVRRRVRFRGPVPHERVADAYADADIFVLPSVCNESFGLPLAEAMACGLPCIVTRTGGLPEIVEDGRTGLVVARGEERALAEALSRLVTDPGMRAALGRAARQRAESALGWGRVIDRLERVYATFGSVGSHARLPQSA